MDARKERGLTPRLLHFHSRRCAWEIATIRATTRAESLLENSICTIRGGNDVAFPMPKPMKTTPTIIMVSKPPAAKRRHMQPNICTRRLIDATIRRSALAGINHPTHCLPKMAAAVERPAARPAPCTPTTGPRSDTRCVRIPICANKATAIASDRVRIDFTPTADSRKSNVPFCRLCLDWSESRSHFAGRLGKALCNHGLERGWIRKRTGSRALVISPEGRRAYRAFFCLEMADV